MRTQSQIKLSDLPGWPVCETVDNLIKTTNNKAWGWVRIGRDGLFATHDEGLWVRRHAELRFSNPPGDSFALLLSSGPGGIALWFPPAAYPAMQRNIHRPQVPIGVDWVKLTDYFVSRPEWVPA